MKATGLDGKIYKCELRTEFDVGARSKHHTVARDIIKKVLPVSRIFEEVSIKIDRRTTLYLDFFINTLYLAIEVDGRQHYEYVPHFHGTAQGFETAQKKDKQKADWCKLNGIKLVRLRYDELGEVWEHKVRGAVG